MKNSLLIATACFLGILSTIGASLPYPILPPLFASGVTNDLNQFLNLPPKLLFGIALSINPLGLLLGSAVLGSMSDRYGRRPLLLVTALGAALGHALTAGALIWQNYPLFIVARFVTGLFEGNASVTRAMLADRLDGPLRLQAMSWLNGSFYIGWLAGPLLAGMTIIWGITIPFWIAAGALVLASLMIVLILPKESVTNQTTNWWQVARDKHALHLIKVPELRNLFLIQLTYTCGVTAFYEFYPLWLVEVGNFDTAKIAWVTALLCAVMTLSSIVAGRPHAGAPLSRIRFHAHFTVLAILCVGFGNLWVGLIAIALFGIPNAFYNALLPNWSSERFGEHGQGSVMGLISMTFCISNILMAIAGSLLTLIDTRLILIAGAALSLWSAHNVLTRLAPSTNSSKELAS